MNVVYTIVDTANLTEDMMTAVRFYLSDIGTLSSPKLRHNKVLSQWLVPIFDINNQAFTGLVTYTRNEIRQILLQDAWLDNPIMTPVFSSNYSLLLNGIDESLDFAGMSSLGTLNSFTFMVWVKTIPAGTDRVLEIYNSGTSKYTMVISTVGGNRYNVIISQDGGYSTGKSVQVTISQLGDGLWHSLSCSYDHTTDTIKLYVDGTVITNAFQWNNPMTGLYNHNSNKIILGSAFQGNLDDLTMFNVVKSDADILTYHNSGVPLDMSGLVGVIWNSRLGDDFDGVTQSSIIGPSGTVVNMDISNKSVDVPL